MKRTASGRYIVYGGMDHPTPRRGPRGRRSSTLFTGDVRRVELPTTCWHLVCHPVLDVFYALSFRVAPADGTDWQHWGMSYLREYAYEVDAETGQVLRHWSADRDLPAHINSDVTISDRELIFCTGGSHTVVLVDLATLSQHRIIDEHPGALEQWTHARQAASTVTEACSRGNVFGNAHLYVERHEGEPRRAAGRHLRLPAVRRPDPAVHREPRPEPHHRLRLPVAGAAAADPHARAAGVRLPGAELGRPAARLPPLLPGEPEPQPAAQPAQRKGRPDGGLLDRHQRLRWPDHGAGGLGGHEPHPGRRDDDHAGRRDRA